MKAESLAYTFWYLLNQTCELGIQVRVCDIFLTTKHWTRDHKRYDEVNIIVNQIKAQDFVGRNVQERLPRQLFSNFNSNNKNIHLK